MLRNEKVIQNFKQNQLDTSHCSSFLKFHGFCQAQICHLTNAFFLPLSGGPDFNGVTEEYGCWRRRLLPAVCGAADVTRRDDGAVLTLSCALRKPLFTPHSILFLLHIYSK